VNRPFLVRKLNGNTVRYTHLSSAVRAARAQLNASWAGQAWSVATVDGARYVVTADGVERVR